MESYEFYARCASGLEALVAEELKSFGVRRVRPLSGGVAFYGTARDGYRACLWSRFASRILLVLERLSVRNAEELYAGVYAIAWEAHIPYGATMAVNAHGTNDELRNTQFSAQKVKDAVCDRLRSIRGVRPDVCGHRPSVLVDVAIRREKAVVAIDFSGESLHRRGYRQEGVQAAAPLKEALAAGIVALAGWQDVLAANGWGCEAPQKSVIDDVLSVVEPLVESAEQPVTSKQTVQPVESPAQPPAQPAVRPTEQPAQLPTQPAITFVDPMCGSGTLCIEAAMMAGDIAPGIMRDYWGFMGWAPFDNEEWYKLLDEADARASAARERTPLIIGCDIDERCIRMARDNARRAGVAHAVTFEVCDAAVLGERLARTGAAPVAANGLIATNPPYGERLSSVSQLYEVYAALASAIEAFPQGWTLAVITPDDSIDASLGLEPHHVTDLYNGPILAPLRIYKTTEQRREKLSIVTLEGRERTVLLSEKTSDQFAARFRKVAKERLKWARREQVQALRLYDADLPDFAIAVDYYEGAGKSAGRRFVRIAEYEAPSSIDAARAARRLRDAVIIVAEMLEMSLADISLKTRRRDKGGGQYREAHDASRCEWTREGGFLFELDLAGHLDTGLFLDHRLTRAFVRDITMRLRERKCGASSAQSRLASASGIRFANLFAYTGTASVYAAAGGATYTVTVDLSQTYLAWAERNMRNNGFAGLNHSFVRSDVMRWISEERAAHHKYDLIFVDPPTFSNSKAMGKGTWSVQRDHAELLIGVSRLLAPGGVAVFSCNLRSFKPDYEKLERYGVRLVDITEKTIPEDFSRNQKVHRCYLMERTEDPSRRTATASF